MLESGFYLMDCLEGMKQFPDGFFNLSIVDPPYGINVASHESGKVVGGGIDRLAAKVLIPYVENIKVLVPPDHITPSPMTVRRTKGISRNLHG